MLEDACKHNIVFNLNEGGVVRHSILLIRGKITSHGSNYNFDSEYDQRHNRIFLFDGSCQLSANCENNEFKYILDLQKIYDSLKEGDLVKIDLRFNYCSKSSNLGLFLEKPRSDYQLQPVYILCADEEESDLTKARCELIDVNLRLVQALYADRIRNALNCPLTTFVLRPSKVFKSEISKEKVWQSDEHTLWNYFGEELLRKDYFEGTGNIKLKIVAFIGCTRYDGKAVALSGDFSYESIRKHLKGHAALGGGDLALFGSGFFYAWPTRVDEIIDCLRNNKEVNLSVEPDDSNYRRTYLGVYSTTLGAVCHELGHIFDLGHCHDGCIMGSGFDFLNRLLTITNHTENLPKRIIGNTTSQNTRNDTAKDITKLTRIKKEPNNFLENYREQKKNNSFIFSRNCAVILANNKWFKNSTALKKIAKDTNITFNAEEGVVECDNQELKIIEIRNNSNSLVEKYFEFSDSVNGENPLKFQLERAQLTQLAKTHYLFVQTVGGESARFDLL